ncbi:AMP-binding protein [Alteraurantiacibacter aquimixticola]|uniref:AMP-dependent synthetase n=1 Tax=Alteraurantiacibacter aquimixticola TaxID=2489173 RepID=A0A4T3F4J6_9SPHN|nr:AMP-binding protein [Alteraurantiacibacter aquimixticola]TIX51711.1 AMP-dependent synthetase [Alteraurantiacibacter aquimixticola]
MIDGEMQDFELTLDKFLRHAAKWHGHAEVVTAQAEGPSQRVTYRDLEQRARAISGQLRALGVTLGDRVATLAWNTQAHMEAWYGIIGMGAVCHTLNPRLRGAQLGAMVAQSEAKVLIVSSDCVGLANEIVQHAPTLAAVLVVDGPVPDGKWDETMPPLLALDPAVQAPGDPVEWGDFDERTKSGLCFTSGTTGAPKGVTYTHRSSFLHTLRAMQVDVMGPSRRDSILTMVPMFHANAWGLLYSGPAVGAKLVFPARQAGGAEIARMIQEEEVTIAVGVPTVWVGLLDHVEATGMELPSLERIMVGGAQMPPDLMRRLEERLGVIVQTSWGMTELSPVGTVAARGDETRSYDLCGRPDVGLDLLITDAEGNPLEPQRNQEGHLRVRGPAVVERYFGHEESATDANGWFPTGDLASIDELGNLMITGRSKDLIKSGGEWINPSEIEARVGALPEVSMAAVIGVPHEKWGERPALFVELRKGVEVTNEHLLSPLLEAVESWWIPEKIVRLVQMPLAPTGKIDKMKLRAEYVGG